MNIAKRFYTSLLMLLAFATLAACAPANSDSPLAIMPDGNEVEGSEPAPPPPADRTLTSTTLNPPTTDPVAKKATLEKYKHLDPTGLVPKNLLEKAILTFDANPTPFPNKSVLGVVDFSRRSNKARWFIIDLKSGAVWAIHVAHGKGSDTNADGYAEKFSNVYGSNMSSLGVYRASETYDSSKFGFSLRVDGLSPSNSNVRERAIVIHPAWYVSESNVIQGRTSGCLGVSSNLSKKLINMIKDGSMILVDLSGTP